MRRQFAASALTFILSAVLVLGMAVAPSLARMVEKDIAKGEYNSYLYGGEADEVNFFVSTATGDVNGDGLEDLIIGHDQGGDIYTYFGSGKVYVYYGRTSIDRDVDLGTDADVTIYGYYASFSGNSVACGDINGDDIDDIIIGAYLDSPALSFYSGGVAVIFGRSPVPGPPLPATWDFNTTDPDLYISSANSGEMCGMSVASGDIDGDGYDDVLFGATLGNGGAHYYDGSSWTAQGRSNQDTIYDVSMYDATHGWAVGEYTSAYDTIYRYNSALSLWEADTLFHTFKKNFYGVAALDATHSWAVGAGGTIIFNNDYNDSKAWAQQASGVTTALRDVAALDTSNVWAVGDGGVIRYFNGTTWSGQASGTTANLRGVSIVDASNIWAVGDGGVILNYNGANWSAVSPSPTTQNLRSVSAVDASNVWAVGDNGIALYYNGATWAFQDSKTSLTLRGVSAVNANTVFAVGDNGTVVKTIDGGITWVQQSISFSQTVNAVDAVDASNVWTVGDYATGRAYIVWGRDTGWPSPAPAPNYYGNPIRPNKIFNGVDPEDSCGFPITVGDLNGDTKDDMVIGAFDADGPGDARTGCGEAYVFYGRNKGAFPYSTNLSTGSDCTIIGGTVMDGLPTSMCNPLENVNGDRYDDIILGVMWGDGPKDARSQCGEIDIIYGGSLPSTIDLATTDPNIMIYGPQAGSAVGYSVDGLDFNGDGLTDIATGSTLAGKGSQRPNCGVAWMVNGKNNWPKTVDLQPKADLVIYGGESGDSFGFSISSANLNGDAKGYDDLIISDALGDGPGNTRPACGEHYIFMGYDNEDPTCSINNMADGSVLNGTVGVEVEAYDFHGIDRVEFWVEGQLRNTDTTAPYRWDWDTREEEDASDPSLEARAYDVNGNYASDYRELLVNNTVPPVSDTWYLAEGTTAWGFEEWILVQNPNPTPVEVTFTFMKPGGETQTEVFGVAENSRFTVLVDSFVNESDVSTRVVGSQPIICERAMYWGDRMGGHDSIGVTEPSPTWYLAEGTTAWGFETYVLVQNPNPIPVDVDMTFMKPGGVVQTYSFPLAAEARYTVNLNEVVIDSDVSTSVQASGPVICERAMYRYNRGLGHDSIGTPSTSRQWYLAEGTTAWGFDEYVLVQNPNAEEASVGVQFMLPDGNVIPFGIVVPGQSRYTIHVDELPGCESTDLSTFITSNVPVICERAMYWQGPNSPGGHDTIGTPMPSIAWYLAEGTTAWGFEEFVLVQNPNAEETVVSFTFMKPDATTEFLSVPVAGNSRYTIKVNDVVPNSDVSTAVVANHPIICERAMYWANRDGGHDTVGVRSE